ncbi:MAG: MBL fold metallo-hydrolase, partial [Geminicoccaceae bacterium]
MTAELGASMRVLRPAANVLAFYDGRVPGVRVFAPAPNWVDDGAYELGIASYAILAGDEALVYDTHISIPHARIIRRTLAEAGAKRIRVVLSHWHLDHVAGNAEFADCEIIAHALTAQVLQEHRAAIEAGTRAGAPAIDPLILPTTIYEGTLALEVGGIPVELRHVDIHSCDGTMLVLPGAGLLLAGDALEDTVTYVAEPDRLDHHRRDLARMADRHKDSIQP